MPRWTGHTNKGNITHEYNLFRQTAYDNDARGDIKAHAQTSVVHEQPPQESEHLTTMHTQVLQQKLTSNI